MENEEELNKLMTEEKYNAYVEEIKSKLT